MTRQDIANLDELKTKTLMYESDKQMLVHYYRMLIGNNINLAGCSSCGGGDKLRNAKNELFAWYNSHRDRLIKEIEERDGCLESKVDNPENK